MHVDINEDKSNYYNQNTFTVLEFSNFPTFDQKMFSKTFDRKLITIWGFPYHLKKKTLTICDIKIFKDGIFSRMYR